MRPGNIAVPDYVALVAVALIAASLVVVAGCGGKEDDADARKARIGAKRAQVLCMDNVRNLVGLFVARGSLPDLAGPNLLLYLVTRNEISKDHLDVYFCPGDEKESLKLAGGPAAYADLDLKKQGHGRLTSYAGRDQRDKRTAARFGRPVDVVLVADDSEDHHAGRGFVVGLSDASVHWRHKIDDWGLEENTTVVVGRDSNVKELQPLRAE